VPQDLVLLKTEKMIRLLGILKVPDGFNIC